MVSCPEPATFPLAYEWLGLVAGGCYCPIDGLWCAVYVMRWYCRFHFLSGMWLLVFLVRVAAIKVELDWTLDVFGIVAAPDSVDHNCNIIFNRTRDIHKESPCLTLTGPTRAVVAEDSVHFEVNLQVKGITESEDRCLCHLAVYYRDSGSSESYMFKCIGTSKLSTVELVLGDMAKSVEATISVRVAGAGWPEGFRGVIFANTTSIDGMKIELLTFRDDKLPVTADGTIQLSRRVVSVEADGELTVSVMAACFDEHFGSSPSLGTSTVDAGLIYLEI